MQAQPINFLVALLMLRSPAVYADQHANSNRPWSVLHRWPAEADDVWIVHTLAFNNQHCRLRCHGLLKCH